MQRRIIDEDLNCGKDVSRLTLVSHIDVQLEQERNWVPVAIQPSKTLWTTIQQEESTSVLWLRPEGAFLNLKGSKLLETHSHFHLSVGRVLGADRFYAFWSAS